VPGWRHQHLGCQGGAGDGYAGAPRWQLITESASLPRLYPRGSERLPFHAAGRHGFGQEMNVRQGIDEKAAGEFGGWSDTSLMRRTYTHAEQTAEKIHEA
jgi:hypothetical protein